MYKKIKKEHLFIFLVLFTAFVLFTYFEEFEYTGLTTKGICEDQGYQCCEQGEGINYFSIDYSCPSNQQCWTSCKEEIKQSNLITTSAVWDNIWSSIGDFFKNLSKNLFKKKVVGYLKTECEQGDNEIFTVSEGHASKFIENQMGAYENVICSSHFTIDEDNGIPLIYLSIDTNAHVEKRFESNQQNYEIPIKINTECRYVRGECRPEPQEECLFSISGDTNAHVGACDEFDINVCCTIPEGDRGSRCGDGIREGREKCDGDDFGGKTCSNLGYDKGILRCIDHDERGRIGCTFDTSQCYSEYMGCDNNNDCILKRSSQKNKIDECTEDDDCNIQCNNNGIKDEDRNEQCDGEDFGDTSKECAIYDPNSFSEGILTCDNCLIKTDNCILIEEPPTIDLTQNCGTTEYETCSEYEYCGYDNNLILNGGFELGSTYWIEDDRGAEGIERNINSRIKNKGSNSYHIKVPRNTNTEGKFISLKQEVAVTSNDYYRLSLYTRTNNLRGEKPIIEMKCKTASGSPIYIDETPELDQYEVKNEIENIIDSRRNRFDKYIYTFLAPEDAVTCTIKPIMFFNGGTGEAWIDSIRFEKIGTSPILNDDCGICGCPTGEYCHSDGTCDIEPPEDLVEICGNGRDDDQDNIKDGLDADCNEYGILLYNEPIPSKTEPYTNSKINVDCNYEIFDENGDIFKNTQLIQNSINCINIEELDCSDKRLTSGQGGRNNVKFIGCEVGEIAIEEKEIICSLNLDCTTGFVNEDVRNFENYQNYIETTINIREYNYCTTQSSNLNIINIDTNKNEYEIGETIEIEFEVENILDDKTIVTKAALVDLNTGEKIAESITQEKSIDFLETEEFTLNLNIPNFNSNTYRLYVKAYPRGDSEECAQSSIGVDIETPEDEGYDFETSCTNNIDDDNDGLIDCEDEDCYTDEACLEECIEGERCDTILQGICSIGTCDSFSECIPTIRPGQRQEIPNNNLDDDCDGQIDETAIPSDSDKDGLPDSWEMQHFNTLSYGPYDDPDNDGISNLEEQRSGTNPNLPEEKKSSLLWLWIILGIILVIAIVFFVFKLLKKPKGKRSYADPRLKAYVQGSLRKGFTKHQIKQALITKGWSQKDIDKILR